MEKRQVGERSEVQLLAIKKGKNWIDKRQDPAGACRPTFCLKASKVKVRRAILSIHRKKCFPTPFDGMYDGIVNSNTL